MEFHPSFVNQYVCVYNDGNAAGIKNDKPFKAEKANDIKFWVSLKKAKKFCRQFPELGLYRITSIVTTQIIEMEDEDEEVSPSRSSTSPKLGVDSVN